MLSLAEYMLVLFSCFYKRGSGSKGNINNSDTTSTHKITLSDRKSTFRKFIRFTLSNLLQKWDAIRIGNHYHDLQVFQVNT